MAEIVSACSGGAEGPTRADGRPPVAARGPSARDRSGACGRSAASSRTCRGGRHSASVPQLTPPTHRSKGGRSCQVSRASLNSSAVRSFPPPHARLAPEGRVARSRWTGRGDSSSAGGSWRGPEGGRGRPPLERRVSSVSRGTDAERRDPRLVRATSSGPAASPPTGRERRCPAPSTGPTAAAALRHGITRRERRHRRPRVWRVPPSVDVQCRRGQGGGGGNWQPSPVPLTTRLSKGR